MIARHHSAADGAVPWWRYDHARRVVFLVLSSATVAVDVCSTAKPRFGAFPVVRHDACTWKLVPVRYTSRGASGLTATAKALHEAIGMDTVELLDAPDDVSVELAELGR